MRCQYTHGAKQDRTQEHCTLSCQHLSTGAPSHALQEHHEHSICCRGLPMLQ